MNQTWCSAPPTQYSYVWISTLSNEQRVPLNWQICSTETELSIDICLLTLNVFECLTKSQLKPLFLAPSPSLSLEMTVSFWIIKFSANEQLYHFYAMPIKLYMLCLSMPRRIESILSGFIFPRKSFHCNGAFMFSP